MVTKKYGADPKAKVEPATNGGTTISHCTISNINGEAGKPQSEEVCKAVSDLAGALSDQAIAVQRLADVLKGTAPGNVTGIAVKQF
jgi:hypothetical protein